jgi:hypothetical protein
MSRDLLIGLISLAAALVLLFLGLPNRREESPRSSNDLPGDHPDISRHGRSRS